MNADPPTLRDQAIDAVGQALNAARYWLPVEGRPVAVDAVLALVGAPAEHCGNQLPRIGLDTFTECVLTPSHHGSHADFEGTRWTVQQAAGPTADEYAASQRRAVTFQARLDDARIWARTNLPADQQYDLLAILGGREGRTTAAIPATLEPQKETPDA